MPWGYSRKRRGGTTWNINLLNGLVAHWKLDEASGDALDAHGANTLTDVGGVGTGAGVVGTARVTTGSKYFWSADNAALSMGDIDFTIAAWAFPTNHAALNDIVSKYGEASGLREYQLTITTGQARMGAASAGVTLNQVRTLANSIQNNVWYFIVAGYNATLDQLFISLNLESAQTASHAGGAFDGAQRFAIGASFLADGTTPARNFVGSLDSISIWKRLLTPMEKHALYNGGNGLDYSGFTT